MNDASNEAIQAISTTLIKLCDRYKDQIKQLQSAKDAAQLEAVMAKEKLGAVTTKFNKLEADHQELKSIYNGNLKMLVERNDENRELEKKLADTNENNSAQSSDEDDADHSESSSETFCAASTIAISAMSPAEAALPCARFTYYVEKEDVGIAGAKSQVCLYDEIIMPRKAFMVEKIFKFGNKALESSSDSSTLSRVESRMSVDEILRRIRNEWVWTDEHWLDALRSLLRPLRQFRKEGMRAGFRDLIHRISSMIDDEMKVWPACPPGLKRTSARKRTRDDSTDTDTSDQESKQERN